MLKYTIISIHRILLLLKRGNNADCLSLNKEMGEESASHTDILKNNKATISFILKDIYNFERSIQHFFCKRRVMVH